MSASLPKSLLALLVCCSLLLLGGCVQLAEVDSTREPKYKEALGRVYLTLQELEAFGIRRTLARDVVDADYVLILTPRGISGPEVTQTKLIPAGTRLRVVGVMTHKFKLMGTVMYVVELEGFDLGFAVGRAIRINDAMGFKMYHQPRQKDQAPELNPEFFRLLEDPRKEPSQSLQPTAPSRG
jgi:hypothetical protein